jgi:hypothetical protein
MEIISYVLSELAHKDNMGNVKGHSAGRQRAPAPA